MDDPDEEPQAGALEAGEWVSLMATEDERQRRLEAQATALRQKLEGLGAGGALHLGKEASDVIALLVAQGLVEVEKAEADAFVVRLPPKS